MSLVAIFFDGSYTFPITSKIVCRSNFMETYTSIPDSDNQLNFIPLGIHRQSFVDLDRYFNHELMFEDFQYPGESWTLCDYLMIPGLGYLQKLVQHKDQLQEERNIVQQEAQIRQAFLQGENPTIRLTKLTDSIQPRALNIPGLIKIPYVVNYRNPPSNYTELITRTRHNEEHSMIAEANYFPTPAVTNNLPGFIETFNILSSNIFLGIDWSNIIIAGGAVLRSIVNNAGEESNWGNSDIDIFFYGLSAEQCIHKMHEVLDHLVEIDQIPKVIIRNERTITFGIQHDYKVLLVSFILRLYQSPLEVIAGFDIDCVKCYYDGQNVYMLPSCYRSLVTRYNLADKDNQTFKTGTYETRLKKYMARGFNIRVPNLDWTKVNGEIFHVNPKVLTGLAKLLRITMRVKGVYSGANYETEDLNLGYGFHLENLSQLQELQDKLRNFAFIRIEGIDDVYEAFHHINNGNFQYVSRYPQFLNTTQEYFSSLGTYGNWTKGVFIETC